MKKNHLIAPAILAGILSLGTSRAHASVLINDFDSGTYVGGVDGWFSYGGNSANYPQKIASPTGGTSTWLAIRPSSQYYGQTVEQNWAVPNVQVSDFINNNILAFDLIVDPSWTVPDFNQTVTIQLGTTNFPLTLSLPNVATNTDIHVALPYTIPSSQASQTAWNLIINGNPGYSWTWDPANPSSIPFAGTFYIDNVTLQTAVVPEPASLALAGLALIPAFLRRRRA
ncbi:MAG TPA: PEP-CTERM sorting domain-containing protein [Phycisphaerae bacterium]|nr:PEP-CTERM sorting domain-containing protein [Phycisphaerae bacterium]